MPAKFHAVLAYISMIGSLVPGTDHSSQAGKYRPLFMRALLCTQIDDALKLLPGPHFEHLQQDANAAPARAPGQ